MVDTPVSLGLAGFEHGYAEGSFLWIVNNIYFQYYSVLITLVSIVVMVGVSYATAPPSESLVGLTFATITPEQRRESRASWSQLEVVASCLIVVAILGANWNSTASAVSAAEAGRTIATEARRARRIFWFCTRVQVRQSVLALESEVLWPA